MDHFLRSIACVLGASRFLALAKPLGGNRLQWVKSFTSWLCFQFQNAFSFHLLPHQFGVVIKDGCQALVHVIPNILNVHID
jgi:hypothetical protein